MFSTPSPPSEERQPPFTTCPFTILIAHRDKNRKGSWRPEAAVQLTPALRTSGFLAAIPPEELKSLLWLFSFLSSNGDCLTPLGQIAAAMRVSEGKARSRLERLAAWQWQGRPVILATHWGDKGEGYALVPGFVPVQEEPSAPLTNDQVPIVAAGREAVIAYSRAHYARPRAEVEAQIARDNGWEQRMPTPKKASGASIDNAAPAEAADVTEEPQQELVGLLQQQGLNQDQAVDLVSRFEAVRIRRQVQWLPYRRARNPGGLLIAAIEDDYEAPPALWQRSASAGGGTAQEPPDDQVGSNFAGLRVDGPEGVDVDGVIELPLPPA